MQLTTRFSSFVLAALSALSACGSGSADSPGSANASRYYELKCSETACDTCQENTSRNCDSCRSICSHSGDGSCWSACSDICGHVCLSCQNASVCEEWEASVPLPPLDQGFYDVCLKATNTCNPNDYSQSYCNLFARAFKPELAKTFQCQLDRACAPLEECIPTPLVATQTLSSYCERAASCDRECKVDFLKGFVGQLRPELEQGLRQCMAEETCAEFTACDKAFASLWALSREQANPGSPSACHEEWLNECDGSCNCGFECVKPCANCPTSCEHHCTTDADCIGTSTGTTPTPHCESVNFCSPG